METHGTTSSSGRISRRHFLAQAGSAGIGGAAIANLLATSSDRPLRMAAAQTTATPAVPTGGRLVVAYPFSPRSLNAVVTQQSPTTALSVQIFDSLITMDKDTNLLPELADSWELAADGLELIFTLNQQATWHDGTPVVAADLKWFFDEIVAKRPNRLSAEFETIGLAGVDAPDPATLIFRASNAPWLPYIFAYLPEAAPLPRHLLESIPADELDTASFNTQPVGTGPWIVSEFAEGEHASLIANTNYYRGRPGIDELYYQAIVDPTAAGLAYETGQVQHLHEWYATLGLTTQLEHLASLPATELITYSYWNIVRFMFNFREEAVAKYPWLADVNVRRAFAHAIDKQALVDFAFSGQPVLVAKQLFTETSPAFWNPNFASYAYDPARAEQLLDEAGLTADGSGMRLSLPLPYDTGTVPSAVVDIISTMLNAVGIQLQPEAMESSAYGQRTWLSDTGYGDLPVTIFTLTGGPHPDGLRVQYHIDFTSDKGGRNAVWYHNPEINQLLDQARREPDAETQRAMWFQAQEVLMDDLPAVPLYNSLLAQVWNTDFQHDDRVSRPIHYIGSYYNIWQQA